MSINSIGSTQANTAGFIPEDWLLTALDVLRNNTPMCKLVTMDTDMESGGFKQGNTLNIPYPGTFTAQDKTAGNPITVAQPSNASTVTLTLSKHKTVDFLIEDFAQAQANQDLMKAWMKPAAIAIAEAVETDLLSLYSSLTSLSVGTIGTGLTATSLRSIRKVFNDNKVPLEDRYLVVSDSDEISILGDSNLQTYFAYSQTQAIQEGGIGRVYGFDIFQSQLVPTAVHSSHKIQTLTVGGSPTGGTFTLTYSGQTTAAIAYNASANAVESAIAALSNVGAGNVRVSGAAGGPWTVILFLASPAAFTHTDSFTGGSSPALTVADDSSTTANLNIAFQKNAILMAVRPFADVPSGMGAIISQMMDPQSGLALRMTAQYDANYKGVHGSLDILYGFTAMRPSLGLVALS